MFPNPADMFLTADGHTVESFHTESGSDGPYLKGEDIQGRKVTMFFRHDSDEVGAKGYKAEEFYGTFDGEEFGQLRRPRYRQGQDLTMQDLYQAFDALVSFHDSDI